MIEPIDLYNNYVKISKPPYYTIPMEGKGLDTGKFTWDTLYDTLSIPTGERRLIHAGILISLLWVRAQSLHFFEEVWSTVSYFLLAVGEVEGFLGMILQRPTAIETLFTLTRLYDETFRVPTINVFIDDNDDEVADNPQQIAGSTRRVWCRCYRISPRIWLVWRRSDCDTWIRILIDTKPIKYTLWMIYWVAECFN